MSAWVSRLRGSFDSMVSDYSGFGSISHVAIRLLCLLRPGLSADDTRERLLVFQPGTLLTSRAPIFRLPVLVFLCLLRSRRLSAAVTLRLATVHMARGGSRFLPPVRLFGFSEERVLETIPREPFFCHSISYI